jgi:hypothetical protein
MGLSDRRGIPGLVAGVALAVACSRAPAPPAPEVAVATPPGAPAPSSAPSEPAGSASAPSAPSSEPAGSAPTTPFAPSAVPPSPPASAPSVEPAPSSSNIEIRLERTACFGSCPVYSVTLYDDGTVIFDGKDHTQVGKHGAHVAASEVRALADELTRAGFFTLEWNEQCGKGKYTDLPGANVTLRVAGRKRTIQHDHGDRCMPDVLDKLEQRIDEVAGTSRWLGVP